MKQLHPLDAIPMSSRIANALVSYVAYLGQFFYPVGLAVFYPHPGSSLPIWKVLRRAAVVGGHFGGSRGLATTVSLSCSSAGSGIWGCSCR